MALVPRALLLLVAIVVAAACAGSAPPKTALPTGNTTNVPTCTPGDQDAYTYRPARLHVLAPCLRVVGTVEGSSTEADGDVHLNVRLDDVYRGILVDGNSFEDGDLIVEPVCHIPPLQADAIRVCAADADPLGDVPKVGDHVWLEGRYLLDLQHHAWAELHPLYRWGRE